MTTGLAVSPLVWNWYVTFVISMGGVLSLAVACATGVLLLDRLFQAAAASRPR